VIQQVPPATLREVKHVRYKSMNEDLVISPRTDDYNFNRPQQATQQSFVPSERMKRLSNQQRLLAETRNRPTFFDNPPRIRNKPVTSNFTNKSFYATRVV
jgi:hypothetical protein